MCVNDVYIFGSEQAFRFGFLGKNKVFFLLTHFLQILQYCKVATETFEY